MKAAEQQKGGNALRRFLPLAGPAACVLLLSFGMVWGAKLIQEKPEPVPAERTGPRLRPSASAEVPRDTGPAHAARPVDEANSEIVPRGRASGWQREPPRPPLGPSALAALPPKPAPPVVPKAPEPGVPRHALLFGPVATAAGRIEVAGHVIEVEGVRVIDAGARCAGRNGRSWPCGAVARAAFRAWVRGRAVECVVTPVPVPKPVLSLCRLGGKDVGEWLVRNGLVEALPGRAYEEAGAQAKAARRGIFGDGPRSLAVSVAGTAVQPVASTADAPETLPQPEP